MTHFGPPSTLPPTQGPQTVDVTLDLIPQNLSEIEGYSASIEHKLFNDTPARPQEQVCGTPAANSPIDSKIRKILDRLQEVRVDLSKLNDRLR